MATPSTKHDPEALARLHAHREERHRRREVLEREAARLEPEEPEETHVSLAEALEIEESRADLANKLAHPDMPLDLVAAFADPVDDDGAAPPREEWDREHFMAVYFRQREGHRASVLLEAAIECIGGLPVWSVLARLEPRRASEPTASLEAAIQRCEAGIAELVEVAHAASPEDGMAVVVTSDGVRAEYAMPVNLLAASAGRLLSMRCERLKVQLQGRLEANRRAAAAAHSARGARGADSRAAMHRRFLAGVQPLRDEEWSRTDLADLILDSATWRRPPCATYVADVMAEAAHDRVRARELIAARLREAGRDLKRTTREARRKKR